MLSSRVPSVRVVIPKSTAPIKGLKNENYGMHGMHGMNGMHVSRAAGQPVESLRWSFAKPAQEEAFGLFGRL